MFETGTPHVVVVVEAGIQVVTYRLEVVGRLTRVGDIGDVMARVVGIGLVVMARLVGFWIAMARVVGFGFVMARVVVGFWVVMVRVFGFWFVMARVVGFRDVMSRVVVPSLFSLVMVVGVFVCVFLWLCLNFWRTC